MLFRSSPCGTYLAVCFTSVSPYLQLWKFVEEVWTLVGSVAGAMTSCSNCSWSPCGTYLAVGGGSKAQWFKRSGDTLTLIGDVPNTANGVPALEWSPCGNFLVGTYNNISPYIMWWRLNTNDTLSYIGSVSSGTTFGYRVSWGKSNYVAACSSSASPYVSLLKISGYNLVFMSGAPSAQAMGRDVSFSSDSRVLASANSTQSIKGTWWKRKGDGLV